MVFKYTNLIFKKRFDVNKSYLITPFKLYLEPKFFQKKRWLYYSMSLFIGANVRSYRLLLGYPTKGQRTWSNGSTNKRNNSHTYNLKFNKFNRLSKLHSLTKAILLAEYINLFWQKQWFLEWFSVYRKIQFTPLHIKRGNLVDVSSILKFNINHNFKYNIRGKKKAHKRKRVFPKNKISIGAPFYFSNVYLNKLDQL